LRGVDLNSASRLNMYKLLIIRKRGNDKTAGFFAI
jgi:hypothetical protein